MCGGTTVSESNICLAYADHIRSLKIHTQELFKSWNLKVNKGISTTWINQSEESRQAKLDRARSKLILIIITYILIYYRSGLL